MKQKQINETLRRNVGVLSEHTEDEIRMMPTSKETPLPSVEDVKQIVSLIKGIVFPDYFDKRQPDEQLRSYQIGVSMEKLYQLLQLFMENPRQLFSVQQLMDRVWNWDSEAEINVVWVNISQLRKKLAELGSTVEIRVHRGAGYSLESGD